MEIQVMSQGKNDPPQLLNLPQPLIDFTENPSITLCLIEDGMISGEPSVIIVSSDDLGSVCLQTSLDKYLSGATMLIALAETRFGWKRPEGYATLLPPSKEIRKDLLEKIKKELEEWDEAEE